MGDLRAVEEGAQLTFDVWQGGKPPRGQAPTATTVSFTGKLEEPLRELYQDEMVVVTIADQHGTVVASGHGNVDVGFKRKVTTDVSFLVREHKVVLG